MLRFFILILILDWSFTNVSATPYPDPKRLIPIPISKIHKSQETTSLTNLPGLPVLRIQVDVSDNETFKISHLVQENSGTEALYRSKKNKDEYGSYQAKLVTKEGILYDAIGTGKEFRKLAKGLTFRFPFFQGKALFSLSAENPVSGKMEIVLNQEIDSNNAENVAEIKTEQRTLREARITPAINLVIYAEGYLSNTQAKFFADAERVVKVFETTDFPAQDRFRITAVFAPSATKLERAQDRGNVPQKRDSFLGLDFPYWNKFGRWYNVVYATNQNQFRTALAQVPYDYPLALVDSSSYWGVGNYKELTAIPADSSSFNYLLLHEFGHFLGLNEEYEEKGRTELEFAPEIDEPWSQNITFHPTRGELKWIGLSTPGISLPLHIMEQNQLT